jgi:hypothetical protein
LAFTAATVAAEFAAAAVHPDLAVAATTAVGANLPVSAPAATGLFLAAASAAALDLLLGLAFSAVPAPVGLSRRRNRQRGRAGGKHPLHHGNSPS